MEYQNYPPCNRFGVWEEEYQSKIVGFSRILRRHVRSLRHCCIDLGKSVFTARFKSDGFHFDEVGKQQLASTFVKVILRVAHASS